MKTPPVSIRPATSTDAASVARIYNHYVAHTFVTFEEEPVSVDEMAGRMEGVRAASFPWLVAVADDVIVGYAYGAPWRPRSAYRFSAEITVYLAPEQARRGLGTKLYAELFPLLKARGIHTVLGGISLPNAGSVALHEKVGMRKVAHLDEVGFKFDGWIDVGYWQRTL